MKALVILLSLIIPYPCQAIDAFLGIGFSEEHKSHQDYVDQLKDRLQYAYKKLKYKSWIVPLNFGAERGVGLFDGSDLRTHL